MRIRAGETDPLERKREAREAPTVGDGLRRFFDEFALARLEMGRLSPRTVTDYRWMAGRFLEPVLGKRKIADVTRDHIEPIVSHCRGHSATGCWHSRRGFLTCLSNGNGDHSIPTPATASSRHVWKRVTGCYHRANWPHSPRH